ncbi:hypothetical protein DXG03_001606 [Asterophora parasitica]|uniref:Uncharacterized protein n=1 Tax=Asterophora parasitica TaxID=117018 RepID=A0A9P7KA82_9AGAR|nr:hypothetical protein DXG03_001606 [Asterophora parasitica]
MSAFMGDNPKTHAKEPDPEAVERPEGHPSKTMKCGVGQGGSQNLEIEGSNKIRGLWTIKGTYA